jgi:hypothetical protein
MYIEFFTPPGEVRESIIKYVRERLTELHRQIKKFQGQKYILGLRLARTFAKLNL